MEFGALLGMLIPIVALVAVFTFISVAAWSDNRRKERETYYRHETYRKLMDHQGGSAQSVIDLMREEEVQRARRRADGLKLGGLITAVSGLGLMVLLYFMRLEQPVYLVGLLPLLIGSVLALFGFFARSGSPDS